MRPFLWMTATELKEGIDIASSLIGDEFIVEETVYMTTPRYRCPECGAYTWMPHLEDCERGQWFVFLRRLHEADNSG